MAAEREFLDFAAGILGVPAEVVSLGTAYGSLPEWDSVMHLRLTLEIEARFGVEIPIDEVAAVTTLGGFYKYLGR